MTKKVEVSHKTIIFAILFILFIWLLFIIREIILQFFVALLIMAVLNSSVTRLSKYKIPRSLSILLIYSILLASISFAIATIIPPLVEQTALFITDLPGFMNKLGLSVVVSQQIIGQFVNLLGALPAQAARITVSLFSNVLSVVTVLVFAFYLLVERNRLDSLLGTLLGDSKSEDLERIIGLLETKLGGWASGQLTLMFIIGLANYIGLRLLGIPFALPLSILAGLLEVVPIIGPIIAATPAVIIGFGTSPILGLATIALAFLVQQLENYILVPKILQKSTGVSPIITLLALAIGLKLAGVVGIIIAVPVYLTASIVLQEYIKQQH